MLSSNMSLSDLAHDTIQNADSSLIKDAKNRDQNAILELVATARIECLAKYSGDEIEDEIKKHLNIKSDEELSNNSDTKYFRGCPVTKDSGERLAFRNPKNDTIHICRLDEISDNYNWSLCGLGSIRGKSKEKAIYLTDQDVDDEYVKRNGTIIGKICGNCMNSY